MSTDDVATAARMRSLVRLARPTAHELRGAASALAIHLRLLGETLDATADIETRERQQRYLSVLEAEHRRLLAAADAFLELVAPPGGAGRLDLAALVSAVGSVVRPLAIERRVRVEIEGGPPVSCLVPDREACRQRLLDAVLEALAAAPPAATLRLALRPDGRHASVVVESASASARTVADVPLAPAPELRDA